MLRADFNLNLSVSFGTFDINPKHHPINIIKNAPIKIITNTFNF